MPSPAVLGFQEGGWGRGHRVATDLWLWGGLPGCMQPPRGAAGRARRKLQEQWRRSASGRHARMPLSRAGSHYRSSLSSLRCHLVTGVPARASPSTDASLPEPFTGTLLEHQSPMWWAGKSPWKDLHGTLTQPLGCDSLGTPFLCFSFLLCTKGMVTIPHASWLEDSAVRDRTHCQLREDDWLAWEGDSKTTTEWAVGIHPQPLWTEHHAQRAVGTHKRTAVR